MSVKDICLTILISEESIKYLKERPEIIDCWVNFECDSKKTFLKYLIKEAINEH